MGRVVTNPTGSVVDASEVKILYESNENTNAYTDGDKASLGEVKNAIDMAKKVVEITFLLNNWTSNSDGTYSQTVNNSEIKSSMNPDLISMLSSGATPEEQKAYMKNFSILCQGVGNTADGSVTYKIYKQMTGDITVGLTRLGGVKQIESEAKVDDVKVGGVSVVKDKVAEIPEIPNEDTFVPYEGATDDVNLGSYSVITGTDIKPEVLTGFGSISVLSPNNVGMSVYNEDQSSLYGNSGIGFYTGSAGAGTTLSLVGFYKDKDQNWRKDTLKLVLGTTSGGYSFFKFETAEGGVKTPFVLDNVAEPVTSLNAANKQYVDNKVAKIKIPIFHDDGVVALDGEVIGPVTIPSHRSRVIPTEKVTLQAGMKIIGVISTLIESVEIEREGMIGTICDTVKTVSSEGNSEVSFSVLVYNPFEEATTIKSITVKYSYITI